MDSYNLHFERMSNVDLHPLSLPVSRLSPTKSSSSIIEQLTHHQHGKGDSAYSSFSGGSTAPDYPSPFLPDELQSNSFSCYADLKYMKSLYQPTQLIHSDSKTMDQLYRSVEAITQQYQINAHLNPHGNHTNESLSTNNKALSKKGAHLSAHPPPIPARLDSYIATKNLENSKVHHPSSEFQPKPRQKHTSHTLCPKAEGNSPNFNSDPLGREPKQQQPKGQHPQSSRTHHHSHHETRTNTDNFPFPNIKAQSDQKQLANTPNRLPVWDTSHSDHLKLKQALSSDAYGRESYKTAGGKSYSESQRKRALSAHDPPTSQVPKAAGHHSSGQGLISSSIQHKGQFYFVTGVCKMSESGLRSYSASVSGANAGREMSAMLERHQLNERERSHSTLDSMFRPFQESSHSSGDTISEEREAFTSGCKRKDPTLRSPNQENHRPHQDSNQFSPGLDTLEDADVTHNQEICRHSANNPIFYCGPDGSCLANSGDSNRDYTPLISNELPSPNKREDPAKKGKRQPLGDVPSEKINKDTTPLLYHLTGANLSVLQSKMDPVSNKKGLGDGEVNDGRHLQNDGGKSDRGPIFSVASNTFDDSFKKYYKERLKDAQCKVLRETSFKRRDLQLSLPHHIRQSPELRPAVIHSFSSSQDSESSTDTLTPSVTSEDTERSSINKVVESWKMMDTEIGKDKGKPAMAAHPPVTRIGGRKRLTAEQKKICYSEPEKLHQLDQGPKHTLCRSFGNEIESLPSAGSEGRQGDQGLVATRRKLFETRGRAMSASAASQTNLKHVQHKALVDYMERKTGQVISEPPQPRQRLSLGEKPSDWGYRQSPGSLEGKNSKKKHRPHSAGRILDSPNSSLRYAQFFSAQSCSGHYTGQNPSKPRQSQTSSQGKSASAESLLDQKEPVYLIRNRSPSTPHAFQVQRYAEDPLPGTPMETCRSHKKTGQPLTTQAPEGQQPVRVVAQRGKSMEELGVSQIIKPSSLCKSSEHLDELRKYSNAPKRQEMEKLRSSYFTEGRELRWQERGQAHIAKSQELVGQSAEQIQNQSRSNEPKEYSVSEENKLSRSNSPLSTSSTHVRAQSATLGSHTPPAADLRSSRESLEPPFSPRSSKVQEMNEMEANSTSSTVSHSKPLCETPPLCSEKRTSSSGIGSEKEPTLDEAQSKAEPPESNHEVPLSCGVTTDPSLWILPTSDDPAQEVQASLLNDDVFEESAGVVRLTETSETPASPHTPVSDTDEKNAEAATENVEEGAITEDTGSSKAETESPESFKDKWEELVETVVRADQSLARVLYPLANRKTALMLMEQVMSEDTLLMEEHYKRKQEQRGAAESFEAAEEPEPSPPAADSQKPTPADPQSKEKNAQNKRLLVSHIEEHLRSLDELRASLHTEVEENTAHGKALEGLVRDSCLPVELERYNLFIGDLERVMNLLLCLSARLARVQNALSNVDEHTDAEEKESLDSRHRLLCKQRDDAKDLKDNLDRREHVVSTFLSRQLSAQQLQDYRCFVQNKASLLIRLKDLDEKQRLGEEQLEALTCSLKL